MLCAPCRETKRASYVQEHAKIEDILVAIENKKWTWTGDTMHKIYIKRTKTEVAEATKEVYKSWETEGQVEK